MQEGTNDTLQSLCINFVICVRVFYFASPFKKLCQTITPTYKSNFW